MCYHSFNPQRGVDFLAFDNPRDIFKRTLHSRRILHAPDAPYMEIFRQASVEHGPFSLESSSLPIGRLVILNKKKIKKFY